MVIVFIVSIMNISINIDIQIMKSNNDNIQHTSSSFNTNNFNNRKRINFFHSKLTILILAITIILLYYVFLCYSKSTKAFELYEDILTMKYNYNQFKSQQNDLNYQRNILSDTQKEITKEIDIIKEDIAYLFMNISDFEKSNHHKETLINSLKKIGQIINDQSSVYNLIIKHNNERLELIQKINEMAK